MFLPISSYFATKEILLVSIKCFFYDPKFQWRELNSMIKANGWSLSQYEHSSNLRMTFLTP